MDTHRGIGRTGSARYKSNTRLTCKFAVGVSHIGDAAFLAADDELELFFTLVNGIENREIGFAGHPKRQLSTMGDEGVDQNLGASLH